MANAFNLTAQLNLRGPTNIKPIIKDIKSQLGNINANVNLVVAKNSSAQVAKLDASLRKLNTTLNTTASASKNAAQSIRDLGAAIGSINAGNVSTSINAAAQASAKLKQEQKDVDKSLQSSRTEMEEFGKQAGLAIRRFAAFSAVTAVVYKLNNAITNGISSFIDFQKEFIRLQQVTGESAQNLSSLRNTITQLSTGLGVASQDLTTVSVTLAQAGLNARETEQALKALAQSALAPSFDNLNNTVEGSIALMRQFDISSNELGAALGSINAVAASFAVEAGDIIKAISRTGGVFANASKGVSEGTDALNEFIAVFTSVRSTTRESAETIATGLRTIFTRIQRGATIDALKEFGVTLTDLEGKFVGPYKAIQLLSEGLSRLDPRDIRFSQIVEELGGFRQIGKVIPLIQQFTVAQRALGVAQAGTGSLAKDATIAQLSLANQITKVREEFLALFREIGSSDSFQIIAKGALSVTSAIISVTDSIKGVLPVLAILAASKGISALTQFGAGFIGGIQRGGGARGFGQRLSGAPSGFARGGLVPGAGNRDTVPAMLTPGEFVIRKKAVETIGAQNLAHANKYASGGKVQKFAKGDRVRQVVEPSSQLQGSHVGADIVLTKKQVQNYANTYKNKKFRNAVEQAGYTLEDLQSGNFNYETLRRNMNLTAKDRVILNLPKSFNQALKTNNPDLVSQQDLIDFIQGSSNLFELTKAQNNKQKTIAARSDMANIVSKLPSRRYNDSNNPQTLAFDHDYELNSLKSAFQKYFDINAVDMMFTAPLSGAVYRKKDEFGNKTGRLQIRRQDRAGAKYSKITQRFADGSAVKQGQQLPGVGIFDSDMIGAGSKDVLNALMTSGKPYDVISGPAGAGKTTFARAKFGNNFILSAADLEQYAQAVVLSGAGATKAGGFSAQTQALMAGARKVIALQPPAERVLRQRQGRIDQATAGSLPDKRSLKQLEGTMKAPATIDKDLYNGLSNVEFVQNFATGGLVEQDTVAGITLSPGRSGSYGYKPNKTQVPVSFKAIETKLKGATLSAEDAKSSRSEWSQIGSGGKTYTVEAATVDKGVAKKFRAILKTQILKASQTAADRLSERIGLGSVPNSSLSDSKKFLQGINDASIGNLFEDTLNKLKGPPFNTDSKANFDFPNGQLSASSNLSSLYPAISSRFVDAKSTLDEVNTANMQTKILNTLATEAQLDGAILRTRGSETDEMVAARAQKGIKYSKEQLEQMGYKAGSFREQFSSRYDRKTQRYLYQLKNLGGFIKEFAVGGSVEDTVPALLTPGEFVINKKAANRIGSAKLHQMNKADKIRGYNKGGFVGFADGGGVPLRPDKISASTVAIPDSVRDSLSQLVDVLRSVGIESANASKIIDNQGRVSYKAALEASKADIERLKIAGASSSDIAAAEKFLLDIRNQAAKEIKTRKNLEKTFKTGGAESAAQQADISLKAEELAQQKIQNVTRARKANNEEVTAEDISKARDSAFLAATRQVTGISAADLKKTGLTGSDIQAYISGTQLDPKEAKKFNDQWLKSRTAILGGSKKAEQQAKQELKAREAITRQIQRARGLPTGGGIIERGKEFLGNLTKGQAGLGASIALPLLTNALVGGEATSSSGAATQAFAQGATGAVSGGLALASIGGPIGIAAGLISGAAGLVKAFADAKNAAAEFARQASRTRIEKSGEQLGKVFEKLAKDAENVDLLRAARTEIATITSESQSLMRANTSDITYGLVNAIEMLPGFDSGNSFQRGEILKNQGTVEYLKALFGGDSERERIFSREQPRLDQENAKIFQQANAQTQQYIQSLVNAGKTATDLLNDPAFLNIAQNLALADANVQRVVRELGGANSAAGRQYLQEVTRERAVEQINISVKTKQLDELNRIAGELSISFSRLFDTMNQQINAASYRLAEFNKNLSASIDSLSGRPSIGTDTSLGGINILQNPLAYSGAEFRGAADTGASFFGGDAELVSGLVQLGPKIEDKLLTVINNVLAASGDNPEKASREINKAIVDELKNLNLPPEIRNKLAREISVAVGDIAKETDKGSISLQDLTEKISGLNTVIQSSQKAREGVINALTYWQNSLNSYSAAMNQMVEIQLEAANRTRRANQIVFDSQVSLANALGQDVSLRFVEREQERETRSRTGGPTDPADIAVQLRALEDRRADQQAALSAVQSDVAAPGASANIVRMTQELSQTNYAIAETRAALENLANNSDLASAALNKIQKAQQDQAGKVSFIEKLVTSTPEQLKNLNNSFADLQRYISGQAISIQESTAAQKAYRKALIGGATRRDAQKEAQRAFADQRGNALSLLKEIGPFLGDSQQANNLRADALETMLRESGIGVNVMMRQVLDAMKNPELDPATAAAIETYKEATRIQSQANLELARLNNDLSGQIAKDTASAIKEALETATVKFDQSQIDAMLEGMRNVGRDGDRQGLAAGGIVYASVGGQMFTPKGTDTVPAMLTPGEFVVNRAATQKNLPILKAINNGYSKGGSVRYYADGGFVAGKSGGGPTDELFSDWQYDATERVTSPLDVLKSDNKKEYVLKRGQVGVGWKLDPGTINMANNKFEFAFGGISDSLTDNNTRYIKTLNTLDPLYTWPESLTSLGLRYRDELGAPSVYHEKNSRPIGVASDITGIEVHDFSQEKKELSAAELDKQIADHETYLKKMGDLQKLRAGEYEYTKDADTAHIAPLANLASNARKPKLDIRYTPGPLLDQATIDIQNLSQKPPTPTAFGFVRNNGNVVANKLFSYNNPNVEGKGELGYGFPGTDIGVYGGNLTDAGIGLFIITPDKFIGERKKIQRTLADLQKAKDLGADGLGLSQQAQKNKKIVDALKKIYRSSSPYVTQDFTQDQIDFAAIGGTTDRARVYGGDKDAFENAFGPNIDNAIARGGIEAKNIYGGRNPGNLLEISEAYLLPVGYQKPKSFAWTQGVDSKILDAEFDKKRAEEEAKQTAITTKQLPAKEGLFKLPVVVDGENKELDIPYKLHYGEWDGKLFDENTNKYSDKLLSELWGSKAYIIGTAQGTNVNAPFDPYASYDAGSKDIVTGLKNNAYNSDVIVKPDYIKKQFEQAAVKDYIGKVLEQGKTDIPEKNAAEALMESVLKGSNNGGDINFFRKTNNALSDYRAPKNIPTNSNKFNFRDYLSAVVDNLLTKQKDALAKADGEVANIDEFTDRYSRDLALLIPAFETLGKTAFGLFGPGAPYNYGAQFGVNVGNLQNLTPQNIRDLSGILAKQLDQYYKNIGKYVTEGSFNNRNAYDLANNAEILSYGAQQVFADLASGNTNKIARYLKPADLTAPNFNWQNLQPQALTLFRAIGGQTKAAGFFSEQLSEDDKLDLEGIIGDGDVIREVGAKGKITKKTPNLTKIGDVAKLAFNPYNRFDEITDRKILINALKDRISVATGPNGRPLYGRQMMDNVLGSMEALKIWFGGEPGANAAAANPPKGFDAEGVYQQQAGANAAAGPQNAPGSGGGVIPGIVAAGSFLPGLPGMVAAGVGVALGLGAPVLRMGAWKGIDYLYDTDPPEPDHLTRYNELQNSFDQGIYDRAKKGLEELGGLFDVGSLPALDYYKTQYRKTGGMIYASEGQLVNFQPKGTDTVPAMLTPGEFVINREATRKNLPLLKAINDGVGGYSSGGVVYAADGTEVPRGAGIRARNRKKPIEQSPTQAGLVAGVGEYGGGVLDLTSSVLGGGAAVLSAPVSLGEAIGNMAYGGDNPSRIASDALKFGVSNIQKPAERINQGLVNAGIYDQEIADSGLLAGARSDMLELSPEGRLLSTALDFASPDVGDIAKAPGAASRVYDIAQQAGLMSLLFGTPAVAPDMVRGTTGLGRAAKPGILNGPGAKKIGIGGGAGLLGLGATAAAYLGLRAYDESKVRPLKIDPAPVYTPAQRAAMRQEAEAFVSTQIKEMKNAGSKLTDEQWEEYRKDAIQQYIDAKTDTAITASRRAKGGIVYAADGTDQPIPRRPFDPGYQPETQKPVKSNRKARIQQFNKLDKNGDGILTSDEFSFANRIWDTNLDNKITLDEYLGWFETASPSDLRSFMGDRRRIADKNRVSAIEENQRQIRDNNRANYEAGRAFQRARSAALREGRNVYEANAAGQQAYANSINNYNTAQAQKRDDIKGGSTDYAFYRSQDEREAAIDRTARLRAEGAAKKAGQQAYDKAKASGRTEDEAWEAYQSSFDDANKPDDYRAAAETGLKEREDRKAKLDQMTPIERSTFLKQEREAKKAQKEAQAAEQKAAEKRTRDANIKEKIRKDRQAEQDQLEADKRLGVDKASYTNYYGEMLDYDDDTGYLGGDRGEIRRRVIADKYTFKDNTGKYSTTAMIDKVNYTTDPPTVTLRKIDPITGQIISDEAYKQTKDDTYGTKDLGLTTTVPLDRLDPRSLALVQEHEQKRMRQEENRIKKEADELARQQANEQARQEREARRQEEAKLRKEAKEHLSATGDAGPLRSVYEAQGFDQDWIDRNVQSDIDSYKRKESIAQEKVEAERAAQKARENTAIRRLEAAQREPDPTKKSEMMEAALASPDLPESAKQNNQARQKVFDETYAALSRKQDQLESDMAESIRDEYENRNWFTSIANMFSGGRDPAQRSRQEIDQKGLSGSRGSTKYAAELLDQARQEADPVKRTELINQARRTIGGLPDIGSDYQNIDDEVSRGIPVGLDARTYNTMQQAYDEQILGAGKATAAGVQAVGMAATFGLSSTLPALMAAGAIEGAGTGYVDAVLDDKEITAAYGELTPEVMLRTGLGGLLGGAAPLVPGGVAAGGRGFLRQALANKTSKEALRSLLKNTRGVQAGVGSLANFGAKIGQTDISGAVSSGIGSTKKFLTDIFTNPEMVDRGFDAVGNKVSGAVQQVAGVPSSIVRILDELDVAQKKALLKSMGASKEVIDSLPEGAGSQAARDAFSAAFNRAANDSPAGQAMIREMIEEEKAYRNILETAGLDPNQSPLRPSSLSAVATASGDTATIFGTRVGPTLRNVEDAISGIPGTYRDAAVEAAGAAGDAGRAAMYATTQDYRAFFKVKGRSDIPATTPIDRATGRPGTTSSPFDIPTPKSKAQRPRQRDATEKPTTKSPAKEAAQVAAATDFKPFGRRVFGQQPGEQFLYRGSSGTSIEEGFDLTKMGSTGNVLGAGVYGGFDIGQAGSGEELANQYMKQYLRNFIQHNPSMSADQIASGFKGSVYKLALKNPELFPDAAAVVKNTSEAVKIAEIFKKVGLNFDEAPADMTVIQAYNRVAKQVRTKLAQAGMDPAELKNLAKAETSQLFADSGIPGMVAYSNPTRYKGKTKGSGIVSIFDRESFEIVGKQRPDFEKILGPDNQVLKGSGPQAKIPSTQPSPAAPSAAAKPSPATPSPAAPSAAAKPSPAAPSAVTSKSPGWMNDTRPLDSLTPAELAKRQADMEQFFKYQTRPNGSLSVFPYGTEAFQKWGDQLKRVKELRASTAPKATSAAVPVAKSTQEAMEQMQSLKQDLDLVNKQIADLKSQEKKSILGFGKVSKQDEINKLLDQKRMINQSIFKQDYMAEGRRVFDIEKTGQGTSFYDPDDPTWKTMLEGGIPNQFRTYGAMNSNKFTGTGRAQAEAYGRLTKSYKQSRGVGATSRFANGGGTKVPSSFENYTGFEGTMFDAKTGEQIMTGFFKTRLGVAEREAIVRQGKSFYELDSQGGIHITGLSGRGATEIYNIPADEVTPELLEKIQKLNIQKFATGGIVYANNGALIAAQSRGTDTVPAMLTPGEFVINRMATQQNRPLLESINSGQFNSGGLVKYLARGGYVSPQRLQDGGQAQQVVQQTQSVTSGVNNVSMERPGWVDEVINAFNGVGPAIMEASSNIGLSAERLANSVPRSVDINQNVNVQGSVGLDSQTLGRAVAMGSQQAGGYTDQKFNNMAAKLQNDTDGGISFTA